jgi:hypothetical protein
VVVLVVFRVVSVSPDGETVVPLVEVFDLSITTPLLSTVRSLLLELVPLTTGDGTDVVDWVDVVLEDEVCATATPVIIARAVIATSQELIMLCSPENCLQTEIACCPVE